MKFNFIRYDFSIWHSKPSGVSVCILWTRWCQNIFFTFAAYAAIKGFCGVRRMKIKHGANSYTCVLRLLLFSQDNTLSLYLYGNYEWTLGVRCAFVKASNAAILFTVKLVQKRVNEFCLLVGKFWSTDLFIFQLSFEQI